MKRINVIFTLFVLFSLGISTVLMGQTHHKKKKHHKTAAEQQAEADSIAAERTKDSLARVAAAAPPAEPVDTSHQFTGFQSYSSVLSVLLSQTTLLIISESLSLQLP